MEMLHSVHPSKIAIIGSGIAGLSAAYLLRQHYHVTLYEKEGRLGGHSRTIRLPHPNRDIMVDTGFIVFNNVTYPHLTKLFQQLKVDIQSSNMSFAASINQGDLEWAGSSLNTWFGQRRNLLNLPMWRGLFDILKFNKNALQIIERYPHITLQEFLKIAGLGRWFQDNYLLPMGAAIWSCPADQMLQFPAHFFLHFFHNHGLLSVNRQPTWLTLKNRSIDYIDRLIGIAKPNLILSAGIRAIERLENQVTIIHADGQQQQVEQVIFACHPQEIISLLPKITKQEAAIFNKFSRQKNKVYTHSDPNWMPRRKKCWSSWNYLTSIQNGEVKTAVTYWMNKLQAIPDHIPLFITLNPWRPIAAEKILDVTDFYHPVFDSQTLQAQQEMEKIQGLNRSWFCGAYLGYGFHEDGIASSVKVAQKMGISSW